MKKIFILFGLLAVMTACGTKTIDTTFSHDTTAVDSVEVEVVDTIE